MGAPLGHMVADLQVFRTGLPISAVNAGVAGSCWDGEG